ncbi:glycosyltransferase involved in cell wall biosynthesis [Micromonospora palomenae]|uniref:Glycosyltransferase involved in cell wall biosynthesis n=1 Tax=Micromonospora palomenae TaxID=1461247 RepID=A0A561VHT1_9ACTN|nr:glycosyltransferase [Micromonospora palomenae]TWG11176.1 glycosyltransferase involved in cell wall biosynthesis [Micromonospora palomenae]
MTTNALPHQGLPTPTALAGKSVALVHEWFSATGGSEQVYLRMAEVVPHARRFVLWKEHDVAEGGEDMQESWMSRTPLRRSKALALPVMPLTWRTLTRERYDVVISSSHAFAHTVKLGDSLGTRYLSYVHSPARYVWSPELDQRGAQALLAPMRRVLQASDRRLSRHVHSYAANSREVQGRIRRYWGREARVINPPVDVDYFADAPEAVKQQGRGYLLGVGRWISYKRFDLMLEIAAEVRLPLVLAGSGPEEAALRRRAERLDVPVTFEIRPTNERLRELYWGALCLLYPGHEDFGMIPVEAQACGTPVVGLARGGLLETVEDGQTGYLVDGFEPSAYAARVRRVAELSTETVLANAQRFSVSAFQSSLASWIADNA